MVANGHLNAESIAWGLKTNKAFLLSEKGSFAALRMFTNLLEAGMLVAIFSAMSPHSLPLLCPRKDRCCNDTENYILIAQHRTKSRFPLLRCKGAEAQCWVAVSLHPQLVYVHCTRYFDSAVQEPYSPKAGADVWLMLLHLTYAGTFLKLWSIY